MAKVGLTNGSYKALEFVVDPQDIEDAAIQYSESGVAKWRHGNDTTDDNFKVSVGDTLGVDDAITIDQDGIIAYPMQPAFLALSADVADVTGDGTSYKLVFDNVIYNQDGSYDGASTFTAPKTGKYRLDATTKLTDIGAAHTSISYRIVTTARSYNGDGGAPSKIFNPSTAASWIIGTDANMIAGDTADVRVTVSGGTKIIDVLGSGAGLTYFSARKIL